MKRPPTYIYGVLFFLLAHDAHSFQGPDTTGTLYFVSASAASGIIVTESKLEPLSHSKPWSVQADFSLLKATQAAWDYCGCYSKTGFSLSYVDFQNPKLGTATSLAAFAEPILYFSNKFQVSLRGGVGLSYLSEVYDEDTNPENLFYSSRVSFLLQLHANAYYALSPAVRLRLSAQLNHISNGGMKWPNYGMNFPMVALGAEYQFHPVGLKRRITAPWTDRSLKVIVHVLGSRRTVEANGTFPDEKRILLGFNGGVVKPLTRVNALGAGGELYYDGITKVKEQQSGQSYHPWFASVMIQHYIFFGKLLFGQQLAYTVTPLNPDESKKFYQRYILGYQVTTGLYGGVSLKAYGNRSDFMALTMGIIF